MKYSTRLGENCDDLQKALELMLGIPHRATDNKFISNIEGYKGNIHKLGRLLTHVSTSSFDNYYILQVNFDRINFDYIRRSGTQLSTRTEKARKGTYFSSKLEFSSVKLDEFRRTDQFSS